MRAALLAIVIVAMGAGVADARQGVGTPAPTGDLAGGYSFLREMPKGGASRDYKQGWFVTGAHRILWDRLWAVGEIDSHRRQNIVGEQARLTAYLGGVRVPLVGIWRVRVFGQVLAGVERFSEPGLAQSAFAFQPGAAVDVRVIDRLGVRVQADYRGVTQDDITYREMRVAAGAVVWLRDHR